MLSLIKMLRVFDFRLTYYIIWVLTSFWTLPITNYQISITNGERISILRAKGGSGCSAFIVLRKDTETDQTWLLFSKFWKCLSGEQSKTNQKKKNWPIIWSILSIIWEGEFDFAIKQLQYFPDEIEWKENRNGFKFRWQHRSQYVYLCIYLHYNDDILTTNRRKDKL